MIPLHLSLQIPPRLTPLMMPLRLLDSPDPQQHLQHWFLKRVFRSWRHKWPPYSTTCRPGCRSLLLRPRTRLRREWLRKIQVAHQRLDTWDSCASRPVPMIDLTNIQEVVDSLPADVDAILDITVTDRESVPIELVEDLVLDNFFRPSAKLQPEPHDSARRHHSWWTTNARDDACGRKK